MPQPKPGRIVRSPGAGPRMIQMLWSTFTSPPASARAPVRVGRTGNGQPRPKKSSAIVSASDEDGPYRLDGADGQVGRVVARQGRVAGAGGLLVVDEHRGTAHDDLPLCARRVDEPAPWWDVA